MRSTHMPTAPRRRRRSALAATGLVAALALTATACGGSVEQAASDKADAAASQAADGIGGDFVAFALLQGVTGLSIDSMVANANLVLA